MHFLWAGGEWWWVTVANGECWWQSAPLITPVSCRRMSCGACARCQNLCGNDPLTMHWPGKTPILHGAARDLQRFVNDSNFNCSLEEVYRSTCMFAKIQRLTNTNKNGSTNKSITCMLSFVVYSKSKCSLELTSSFFCEVFSWVWLSSTTQSTSIEIRTHTFCPDGSVCLLTHGWKVMNVWAVACIPKHWWMDSTQFVMVTTRWKAQMTPGFVCGTDFCFDLTFWTTLTGVHWLLDRCWNISCWVGNWTLRRCSVESHRGGPFIQVASPTSQQQNRFTHPGVCCTPRLNLLPFWRFAPFQFVKLLSVQESGRWLPKTQKFSTKDFRLQAECKTRNFPR